MNTQEWVQRCEASKVVTADEAVRVVRRGQRVFIGSGCAEPTLLVEALSQRGPELSDTQIAHIMTLGIAPYTDPKLGEHFRHDAYFIGPNVRDAVAQGRADYTPIFLSEIPRLFRSGRVPIDVAMIQVSPPDEHGYCSYGVSVDVVKAGAESARIVLAEVNSNMPRTLGDSFIHVRDIDSIVPSEQAILETSHGEPDEIACRIGRHIAGLIEDGSTLQMGIGTIPDAVLNNLMDKRDLGIHTEMFSEGVIPLVEAGVVTGARKTIHRGKIIASFVMGTRRLYDFIDNNPLCEFHPTEYTNDPFRVAQNDRMVAINSALQVDLSGQVCADSLGTYFYSGIGGQVDFVRGAARSSGGKPIIALPSTARDGRVSRITPTLNPGAGVVTSRGDVHWIVTEWGATNLHGKNIRQRALSLIHIAHPKFRDRLMEEARERHYVSKTQVAVLGLGEPELESCVSEMVLEDGTRVLFRPIEPTDADMHREMFYSFSPNTVYHRFFHSTKRLSREEVQKFTSPDYATEMALVAIARLGEHDVMLGVGRYEIDMATNSAEVAFVIRDEWQHKGIGKRFFESLIKIARTHHVTTITAEVLADNAPMVNLFHQCATGPLKSILQGDTYLLSFALEPVAKAAPEQA